MNSSERKEYNEEVELSQFLVVLGRGFLWIKRGIVNLFKSLLLFIINILLFIKRNFIYVAISLVLSGAVGITMALLSDRTYESVMIVKPNFSSVSPLYQHIEFLNRLIKEKNSKKLTEILGIDEESASVIKEITIEPFKSETEKLKVWNSYLELIDTSFAAPYTMDELDEVIKDEDYQLQIIKLVTNSEVDFRNYTMPIIRPIVSSPFYQNKLKTSLAVNNSQIDVLNKTMRKLDTLQKIYNQVLLERNKSEKASSNNFFLGNETNQEKTEEWIYDKYISTNRSMEELITDLDENQDVISIISNFSKYGNKVSRIFIAIIYTLVSLGICLLILIIIKINQFLTAFEQKKVTL